MPRYDTPFTGANIRKDIISGLVVFLIALLLCLGIAMASGFPPIAGIITAVVGGVLVSFLGSARLTIKGPAAGLIVIVLGAVTELGAGDPELGYRRALAVGVVAGVIQIVLALARAGVIRDLMPPPVVHGMLAAIGIIIISRQAHTVLGVAPQATDPLGLIAELPASVANANPELLVIGGLGLLILFGMPLLRHEKLRKVPAPLIVLLVAIPLGLVFDLDHEHTYSLAAHQYTVGPQYLVQLPGNVLSSIQSPDFSEVTSMTSIKYIVMLSLVGSIESLLSVSAVDSLDPARRTSHANRDLLATGIGNTVAAAIGGLPMLSEIVRSKANIDSGATSPWSNFFHGLFLLVMVTALPGLLHQIPLAALAAMLVYTGFRLASPSSFRHAWQIGPEQLLVFVTTLVVTLATDLLVGVGVGIVVKLGMHLGRGVSVKHLLRAGFTEYRDGERLIVEVHGVAVFTNYLGLRRKLDALGDDVREVVVDFSDTYLVDHTVMEKLHLMTNEWKDRTLTLEGLHLHQRSGNHELASHHRERVA